MLDRKLIRKDPEKVKKGVVAKGVDFDIDGLLELDRQDARPDPGNREAQAEKKYRFERNIFS